MEKGKHHKASLQYQPRNPSLEDYWQECSSFHESNHLDEDEDDAAKTPDEGEAEEEWLREAGFESLVESEVVEDHYFEEILSTLTARQRAVVRRRFQTVQRSKSRRKNAKGRRRADVRQVFNQLGSEIPSKESSVDSLESIPDKSDSSVSAPCSMNFEPHQNNKNSERSTTLEEDHQTPKSSRSSSSSVIPPFLRTGHTGGFNLWEHGKCIDGESPNSVEVLKYEARTFPFPENYQRADTRNSDSPEVSYQGIASRLDPAEETNSVLDCMGKDHVPISDLSEDERVMVRSLAIIEVAALMDSHGLVPSRRRKGNRKKGGDNVVFGASLSSLLELDRRRCPGLKIPLIYQWILHHLHESGLIEEGLMRLAGSVQKVEALKTETERGYLLSPLQVEASLRHSSIHDVAVLLKQLIRNLPEPLLTNSHTDAFLQVPSIPSVHEQIIALNLLVLALPDVHRELLQELLYFLSKVVEFEHLNRMTLPNVAMIMAPNIFPPPRLKKSHKNNDLAAEVTVAALSSKVTQLLIKFGHFLGSVPRELLMQSRMQTMYSNKKHGKKADSRKPKSERFKLEKDVLFSARSYVIRVHVTSFCNPCSVPVAVDESTTAGDVVEKVATLFDELKDPRHVMLSNHHQENRNFLQRLRTTSEPLFAKQKCAFCAQTSGDCLKDHFLYQIDQTFGERMLDHNATVFGFLHIPGTPTSHASTWEIRCHHQRI